MSAAEVSFYLEKIPVSVVHWKALVDGVEHTLDLKRLAYQPRLLNALSLLEPQPYAEWRHLVYGYVCTLGMKFFHPSVSAARSLDDHHRLWYDYRARLLELLLMLVAFHRYEWDRQYSTATRTVRIIPTPYACPSWIVQFASDAQRYAHDEWPTIEAVYKVSHYEHYEHGYAFLRGWACIAEKEAEVEVEVGDTMNI